MTLQLEKESAYCYILYNKHNNRTYNGYTTNFLRRIRQHNGEIKGGAVQTLKQSAKYGPGFWEYLMILECDEWDKVIAQSVEWSIRYPTNRKPRPKEYYLPEGRIESLIHVFQNKKFNHMHFTLHVEPSFYNKAVQVLECLDNVKVYPLVLPVK